MPSTHIIYASTSGHTEYVVNIVADALKRENVSVDVAMAERVKPEDFVKGDLLILASSTWNTGNAEGQLNPHMDALLRVRAKDVSLQGKKVALIALGDSRYRYTANAAVHLEEFVKTHGGELLMPAFKIINEPYGQEAMIEEWSKELSAKLEKNHESGIKNHDSSVQRSS